MTSASVIFYKTHSTRLGHIYNYLRQMLLRSLQHGFTFYATLARYILVWLCGTYRFMLAAEAGHLLLPQKHRHANVP